MLWIALELPSLPLQIVERGGISREPLVVCEGPVQRPLVACANKAAKAAGIREGQAVAAAKVLAGDLKVAARDLGTEKATLERIAAWAGQFAPMVTIDGHGISLEVESTLRLFEGHAKLTSAITRGIRELGFQAACGVAPTPLAARVFARGEARGLPVRSCLTLAELRERLADLPLFLLDWPESTLAHLTDLGIMRLRAMLELPHEGVARRFGPAIMVSLERLLGNVADPRVAYVPPARFDTKLELPAEADGVEALLFPLRRMLVEFEGAMRGRGAGVQRMTLVLKHGRKSRTRVPLEFATPEREADFILAIAREKLGRLTLTAPTLALSLHADALLPFAPRTGTWLPGSQEQAIDRERLIQRLAARMGNERVFGIEVANDHRPEKTGVRHGFSRTDSASENPCLTPVFSSRPTWLLHNPQRLIVEAESPCLHGPLAMIAGPERIEAGWWDGAEACRDYYVAANERGERYWIFREHRGSQAWYLHGIFA
jgi:protein ImuB